VAFVLAPLGKLGLLVPSDRIKFRYGAALIIPQVVESMKYDEQTKGWAQNARGSRFTLA